MPDQDKIAKALRDVEPKLHCRDSNLFPILRDERGVLAEEWIPYNGTNGFERNNTHVAEPLPILDRHHVRSAAKHKPARAKIFDKDLNTKIRSSIRLIRLCW